MTRSPLAATLLKRLAPTASEEVLAALVRSLLPQLSESEVREVLLALLAREEPLPGLLSSLAGELPADLEQEVAAHPDAPGELLVRLGRSRRKRTLQALVERADLPEAVAVRLAASSDARIARRARMLPSYPTRERVALVEEGVGGDLAAWCEVDSEFCAWLVRRRHQEWRESDPTERRWRSGPDLHFVPAGELGDDVVDALTMLLADVPAPTALVTLLRRGLTGRMMGEALALLGSAEKQEAFPTLGDDLVAWSSRPLLGRRVHTSMRKLAVPLVWTDATSLEAAYRHGGAPRLAALPHPRLDPALRREAALQGTSREQLIVAHNPALTTDEAAELLWALPPDERWRLLAAPLTQADRHRVARDAGRALWTLVVLLHENLVERRWLPAWRDRELLARALQARSEQLERGCGFSRFSAWALEVHPDLTDEVVAASRPGDHLPDPAAAALAARCQQDLTGSGAETLATLLPGWSGTTLELLEAARALSQESRSTLPGGGSR